MNPAVLANSSSFIITFLASVSIYFMFFGLFVLWVVDGKIKKEQVLHAILAVIVGWAICEIIKSIIPIPRPFQVNGLPPLTLTIPSDHSFPSSHAAIAFALATSIWLHNKRTGYIFGFLAIIVAWARILGNVHYLPDVLAGASIGIVTAYIVDKLHLKKLLK